jgi:hypothetical protein
LRVGRVAPAPSSALYTELPRNMKIGSGISLGGLKRMALESTVPAIGTTTSLPTSTTNISEASSGFRAAHSLAAMSTTYTRGGESTVSEAALLERIEQLTTSLHTSLELMNAQEAADFVRMPYSEFRRLAPYLPRHRVTEWRYVYQRKELLEWVLPPRKPPSLNCCPTPM